MYFKWYKRLYNSETADDIFKRKKLRYREDILDNMNEEKSFPRTSIKCLFKIYANTMN